MRRSAFTLIELLLVLAVIVIVSAMVMPAIFASYDREKLVRAGELVRAEWGHARNQAMKTGRIQVFRYQPNSDRYLIECFQGGDDANESTARDANSSAASGGNGASATQPLTTSAGPSSSSSAADGSHQLSEGVTFLEGTTENDTRAAEVDQTPSATSASSGNWAPPVLFYPDGSSSSLRLPLQNSRGYTIELTLRGLTGGALVTEPQSTSEGPHVSGSP